MPPGMHLNKPAAFTPRTLLIAILCSFAVIGIIVVAAKFAAFVAFRLLH